MKTTKPRLRRHSSADIPERDTPEAVILLLRFARANLMRHGKPMDGKLIDLAGALNARLPAATRVKPDDPRLREPINELLDRERYAMNTIAVYVAGPALPAVHERTEALVSLLDYFVWCHALWKAFQAVPTRASSRKLDKGPNRVDDLDVQGAGIMLHWLAGLGAVVNGWEELELFDLEVDARIATGGKVTAEGSYRHGLEWLRRTATHFQRSARGDGPFQIMGDRVFLSWAMGLQQEFERFFRRAKDPSGPAITEWAVGGFEGLDLSLVGWEDRPDDPLAIAGRLMALLMEPTAKGAMKRRREITRDCMGAADLAPWVSAVVSLQETGSLSADAAMYLLFGLVVYLYTGLDASKKMQFPAYLRRLGAHEAAELLDQSFDTYKAARDRGNEEFHRRWSGPDAGSAAPGRETVQRHVTGRGGTGGPPTRRKSSPRSPKMRKLTPLEHYQTVLSATNRSDSHELLSQISIMVGIFDKPDRWVAAIAKLRDMEAIGANESFYFLEALMDNVVAEAYQSDPELVELLEKERAIEILHGIPEGELWPGDAPPEYRQLEARSQRRLDEVLAAHWRSHGAHEAADALDRSRTDFNDLKRLGRVEFDRRWPVPSLTA